MKKRSKNIIYGVAIATMIIAIVFYLCGFQQFSGYVAFIAIPSCIAAVTIERHAKLKGARFLD